MNKFFVVFVALCLIGQSQAGNLRLSASGDLRPEHRRLSEEGQLKLSIDGRGYFQFRLRVPEAATDIGSTDDSQKDPDAATDAGTPGMGVADGSQDQYDAAYGVAAPTANAQAGGAGNRGSQAHEVETADDGDASHESQVIYSRDGSLHINKFGYLVDDNGLLLIGELSAADNSDTPVTDVNAKFHIKIPSRADGVLVTPSGQVLAEELGGSKFTKVGQIMLARFENPQGLNIRLKMKSNCAAANEDGFALGNWCAGGELDGKDHTYMAETSVSGVGIIGKPGAQGFGRIVQ